MRRKTRQKLVQDAADQILGVGVAGVQGASPEALEPGGGLPRGGGKLDFGQLAVSGQRQNPAHVAEASEGGNEFNEVVPAEGVQGFQIVGVEGIVFAGNGRVETEPEGVLEVELKVIDFERGQKADAAFEHVQARNAAAADIQIISPQREGGRIGNLEAGQGVAGLLPDLTQGLQGVEKSSRVRGGQDQARGCDLQAVGFRRPRGLGQADKRLRLMAGHVMKPGKEFMQYMANPGVHIQRNPGGRGRWYLAGTRLNRSLIRGGKQMDHGKEG